MNYIGPVGAWAAWGVFKVFGLVGFLFPLLLAVWGVIDDRAVGGAGVAAGVVDAGDFVRGCACWWIIQASFWNGVAPERLNLSQMPGGIDRTISWGGMLLTNFLGVVGAAIISVGVIVGGLFFVSQTHPAELWRALVDLWGRWQERREAWAASRRTAQEQAEREAMLLEREREKLERELEKERRHPGEGRAPPPEGTRAAGARGSRAAAKRRTLRRQAEASAAAREKEEAAARRRS